MPNNIDTIFKNTFTASKRLQRFSDETIRDLLQNIAREIEADETSILKANQKDVQRMAASDPLVDRLLLNKQRLQAIADSIRTIAELPSPVGKLILKRKMKKGLELKKMTVPFGVVGVIYESRPNVTFDTSVLCLKSKNACLLKGSRHADETNKKSVQLIQKVLKKKKFPPDCVSLLPSDRRTLEKMFVATKYIDLIIPRGSQQLIDTVRQNSLVPVIETGAGVCHVYVHKEANMQKALQIVKDIVGTVKPTLTDGHLAMARATGAGEYAISLNNYVNLSINVKLAGSPIEIFALDPVALFFGQVAINAKAPSPNAAKLAANFMLSQECQQFLAKFGRLPTRSDVKDNPPGTVDLLRKKKVITTLLTPEEERGWQRRFAELFKPR